MRGVPRLCHLTDLHLLEDDFRSRRRVERLQVGYLSLRRTVDPEDRRARAAAALRDAAAANPDHVLISGDLTELGSLPQYDLLRQLLDASGLCPEQVTLLAGNHDAYGLGWRAVLDGPLDRWAAHARPGAVVPLPAGVKLVHVDTSTPQPFWLSSGTAPRDQLVATADTAASAGAAVIMAMHHPPHRVLHHWVHGLRNLTEVEALLAAQPRVVALFGHMHVERDLTLAPDGPARAYAAAGVVDHDRPVRVYEFDATGLWPLTPAAAPAARRGSGAARAGEAPSEPTPR